MTGGGGVKIGKKKRYVIVERPLMYQVEMTKTSVERGKCFQCQSGGASGLCPQPAVFRPCAGGVV